MTALLFVLYPVYLLLVTISVFLLTKNSYAFLLLPAMPALAWTYVRLKPQLDV